MKALLIGCGQGGSRLVEAIMKIQCATYGVDETNHSIRKQFEAMIVNTTVADMKGVETTYVHENHRLVIGGGYSPTSGRGAGGDPRLGTLAANHDRLKIEACLDEVLRAVNLNPSMNNVDVIMVVSALGGGSGSGMGPVIAKILKQRYADQYPIIGLISIPAKEEGHLNSYNAYISIQSWLKESNFDGIITIELGGRSLKATDDSLKYFARFNKSVAKALYILCGGGTLGEGSKTVDVNDILTTIKEGGGICTLGHMSCPLPAMAGTETQPDCPLLSVETGSGTIAGSDVKPLLDMVGNVFNHLFLTINLKKVRTGLLVIKDTHKFPLTHDAGMEAANRVAAKIGENGGYIRFAGLGFRDFPLKTDNSRLKVFNEYEISDTDQAFSRNETVEVALLLSGISEVAAISNLKLMAEKVIRFSKPPRGARLLADTLGLSISEAIDNRVYLPCSNLRDDLDAQIQSRATSEALKSFVKDLKALNRDLLSEEKIRKGIVVLDVKPVPDLITCDADTKQKNTPNCYEIEMQFKDFTDATVLKKSVVVKIQFEIKIQDNNELHQKVTWISEDVIQNMSIWTLKERTIINDVMRVVLKQYPDAVLCGIGNCPDITGFIQRHIKLVKVVVKSPASSESEYQNFYWIDSYPKSLIFSQEGKKTIQNSGDKEGFAEFNDIYLEKKDETPSTEKIQDLFKKLNVPYFGGESNGQ